MAFLNCDEGHRREAAKWTKRAAENGHAIAQTDFGFLYEQGVGVPLDYSLAYQWYLRAERGGDHRSAERLKKLSRLMTAKQIEAAKLNDSGNNKEQIDFSMTTLPEP